MTLIEYEPKLLAQELGYCPETGSFTATTNKRKDGYLRTRVHSEYQLTHRLVWFIETGEVPTMLDHKDGNKENNHISNLREATRSENNRNREVNKTNKLGLKNISERTGKYCQFICRVWGNEGKRISKTFSFKPETREAALTKAIHWVEQTRQAEHKDFACSGRNLTERGVGY